VLTLDVDIVRDSTKHDRLRPAHLARVVTAVIRRQICDTVKSIKSNMTLIMVDRPQPSYNLLNAIKQR